MEQTKEVGACLVVGAGDDTGAAIGRAFAREGLTSCLVRRPRHAQSLEALAQSIRDEGFKAVAMPADARVEEEVIKLVETIESSVGPLEVAVFNIGANVQFSITETTARVYQKVWEMACFAGFLMGREVAKRMLERGRGTIIFTGATASMRGRANLSAFAGAKHGLRALAQSMARELGPKNIHVAHTIIDGAIDSNFIRELLPQVDELREQDAILNPDHIAQNYVMLHKQPRTAWTHELDLRPWKENW
ncbi:Gluconate 5-dehydrogenase [Pseudovibrio axinellae]|uniref:Gluconate 5-dehydrogenase n=1 Tax=Pseudovibrio axinellae TaxID=989403 RepID=A0A165VTT8_9HYPH|nr:SDR family oxidoreductase [Pseudovibrio axinellae]KZL15434.1 Gluconate 5-dehydrogenase [Pseudovibrio axinellae]SER56303.1 Short-chain dehydrogenase [Pseudovibrio axinellae]